MTRITSKLKDELQQPEQAPRQNAVTEPGIAPALDEVDQQILRELSQDSRTSISVLATRAHISRAHAYNRVSRLIESGVLRKFTISLDPLKAGLLASAYVTLKVKQNAWRELRDSLRQIPEVKHIALLGGSYDVILLVRAQDNEHLRRVIFDKLQAMPGILDSQTSLIFEDLDA